MLRIAPIFRPFCRYWRVSDKQARQFWSALVRSRAEAPSQWRQQLLLLQDTSLGTSAYVIDQVSTPATVMAVLEALIEEGTLRAEVGRAIEECVLGRTDATGAWKARPVADSRSFLRKAVAITL
jgi:hypothetical protein